MPLPETISAKYTEEEAGHLSIRPVVQQTFRAPELVDMVVQVAGKNLRRVQKVFRAGTVIFHSYRYWWDGFDPDPAALQIILDTYPDADPSKPFVGERCGEVILESSGSPPRHSLHIKQEAAQKRGFGALFRHGNFWDAIIAFADDSEAPKRLHYQEYSYALRADLYSRTLNAEDVVRLAKDANRFARRELRVELMSLPSVSQIVFVCHR